MAKRVHAPKTPKPKQPERPRPHGWHEWLANARREAEVSKQPHGKAIVLAEKPDMLVAKHAYTTAEIETMSKRKWRLLVAERLGLLAEEAQS